MVLLLFSVLIAFAIWEFIIASINPPLLVRGEIKYIDRLDNLKTKK